MVYVCFSFPSNCDARQDSVAFIYSEETFWVRESISRMSDLGREWVMERWDGRHDDWVRRRRRRRGEETLERVKDRGREEREEGNKGSDRGAEEEAKVKSQTSATHLYCHESLQVADNIAKLQIAHSIVLGCKFLNIILALDFAPNCEELRIVEENIVKFFGAGNYNSEILQNDHNKYSPVDAFTLLIITLKKYVRV